MAFTAFEGNQFDFLASWKTTATLVAALFLGDFLVLTATRNMFVHFDVDILTGKDGYRF
jgi:hypothetical protein